MSDWVCGRCKSINRDKVVTCYSCGGGRGAVFVDPADASRPASADHATDGQAEGFAEQAMEGAGEPVRPPAGIANILGGLAGGVGAGVIATAVWYGVVAVTQFQVGLVAIAVGWLVGQGVVLGAARRGSIVLVPISVGVTAIALALSEYLIVAHFVGQELAAEGLEIELLQPPDFVLEVVVASLEADPLTLVFWAIALFQAVVIPFRLLSRPAS